jgi:tetratricopeptide (TPR) repeat protein
MSRHERRKSKGKKSDASQRMNRLKAKALTQVAGQAWAVNQRHKTIALLTEALRREPTNTGVLLKLASAYGRQRYYEKAEELLARLLHLAPRKASVCHQAAQVYAAIDRPEQAVDCYRRCLELYRETSKAVPALVELAALHERRHELDEARTALAEALQHAPDDEGALLQQALLQRRGGETAQAEMTLRALIGNAKNSPGTRTQAWYELAHLLDDAEQYDEAYRALVAAKQIARHYAGPHLREHQTALAKNREMLQQLDQSYYDNWKAAAAEHDSPYRFALLTSHPRSGTTLVEQMLDSHPDAISADEFDVFTHWIYMPIMTRFPITHTVLSILDRVPPAVRQQARATYWQQTEAIFAEPIGGRLLVDKNPAMTLVLPAVNWAFPEAKMLIALRDPRDVILSCFMQRLQPNPISVNWLSLEAAAEFYACLMETWLAVRKFTEGLWIEFRYEDVVADLEGQSRRILEFLGLPWDDKVLKFYEHAREKMVRSPTYQDVTRPVYQGSVNRWQHYAKHFEPLMPKLEPFLKEFGYSS